MQLSSLTFSLRYSAFSFLAFAALFGCQGQPTTTTTSSNAPSAATFGNREPASAEELEEETSFMAMLNDVEGSVKLKANYLERLLNMQYKAEFYVTKFEAHLDDLLAKQKANPNQDFEPLDNDSYRHLLEHWMISARMTHKLNYVYKRLNQTIGDTGAPEDLRRKAMEVLNETHKWLDERPEEDKLQLIELYQSLGDIKKEADQANAAVLGGNRQTASAFADFAYMDSRDLQARFRAKAKIIAVKARARANYKDPDESGDVSWFRPESDRKTASPVLFPSTGPEGNVYGAQFPAGTFVFTFDDGPGPHSTQRLHGVLKAHADPINAHGAPATFFCLVNMSLKSPNVIAATKAAGYHMNNHSWTHPNFAKLNQAQLQHEVVDSTPVLEKMFGYKFRFFRCPYGACFAPKIPAVRQMIADQKLIHAYWRVDSEDWKNIGQPERTFALVTKQIQLVHKGVILMHDSHESSVDAAALVLKWIKTQNSTAGSAQKIRLLDLEAAVDEANGVKVP